MVKELISGRYLPLYKYRLVLSTGTTTKLWDVTSKAGIHGPISYSDNKGLLAKYLGIHLSIDFLFQPWISFCDLATVQPITYLQSLSSRAFFTLTFFFFFQSPIARSLLWLFPSQVQVAFPWKTFAILCLE